MKSIMDTECKGMGQREKPAAAALSPVHCSHMKYYNNAREGTNGSEEIARSFETLEYYTMIKLFLADPSLLAATLGYITTPK